MKFKTFKTSYILIYINKKSQMILDFDKFCAFICQPTHQNKCIYSKSDKRL